MVYDDMKQYWCYSLKVSFNFSVARTSNSICYILGLTLTLFIFGIITNTIHKSCGKRCHNEHSEKASKEDYPYQKLLWPFQMNLNLK